MEISKLIQIPRSYQWFRLKKQMQRKFQFIPRPHLVEYHQAHIRIFLGFCYSIEYKPQEMNENEHTHSIVLFGKTSCCQERSQFHSWKLDTLKNSWAKADEVRLCECDDMQDTQTV